MRVTEALREGKALLEAAGWSAEEALREVRMILGHILGVRPLDVYLSLEREIPEERFRKALAKRMRGVPLAYILGQVEFYGRVFRVEPGALIPRPETEVLVETVLAEDLPPGPLLELGVGSGVVLLTLLAEDLSRWGVGVDVSPLALRLTRRNAEDLGLAERTFLVRGDWLSPLAPRRRFAALVTNPPYVAEEEWAELPAEVRDHEPREALWGGPEGLVFIRRTIVEGPPFLRPGGKIFLEIGYNQKDRVRELCEERGFAVRFVPDLSGTFRVAVVTP